MGKPPPPSVEVIYGCFLGQGVQGEPGVHKRAWQVCTIRFESTAKLFRKLTGVLLLASGDVCVPGVGQVQAVENLEGERHRH